MVNASTIIIRIITTTTPPTTLCLCLQIKSEHKSRRSSHFCYETKIILCHYFLITATKYSNLRGETRVNGRILYQKNKNLPKCFASKRIIFINKIFASHFCVSGFSIVLKFLADGFASNYVNNGMCSYQTYNLSVDIHA